MRETIVSFSGKELVSVYTVFIKIFPDVCPGDAH